MSPIRETKHIIYQDFEQFKGFSKSLEYVWFSFKDKNLEQKCKYKFNKATVSTYGDYFSTGGIDYVMDVINKVIHDEQFKRELHDLSSI